MNHHLDFSTTLIRRRKMAPVGFVLVTIGLIGAVLLSVLGGTTRMQAATVPVTNEEVPQGPTASADDLNFSAAFSPSSMGPGSSAELQFFISNTNVEEPISEISFTNSLPTGLTIAGSPMVSNDCGGSVTASAGGSSITLTEAALGVSASCTISVNVTGSTPETYINETGDLTSEAGNSGPTSATLIISSSFMGFSKAFEPAEVVVGVRSSLTITMDNSLNAAAVSRPGFVDTLPSGLVVASPANLQTTCTTGEVTAVPGSNSVSYSNMSFIPGNEICTVSLDVVGLIPGVLENKTNLLLSGSTNLGYAVATLHVTNEPLTLVKSFVNDPAAPGGTVYLQYSINNFNRSDAAEQLTFTDDFGEALTGLAATGLPQNNICGSGSSLTGSDTLIFSGGNLSAQGSCTFTVTLQVPLAASVGA